MPEYVPEIERWWLGFEPELPPLKEIARDSFGVRQYYTLSEDGRELRMRNENGTCYKTEKLGDGLARQESVPVWVSTEEYTAQMKDKVGLELTKVRYELGGEMHVDVFTNPELAGLIKIEKEFPSVEAANAYAPPAWCALEVTGRKEFSGKNLARNGVMPELARQFLAQKAQKQKA